MEEEYDEEEGRRRSMKRRRRRKMRRLRKWMWKRRRMLRKCMWKRRRRWRRKGGGSVHNKAVESVVGKHSCGYDLMNSVYSPLNVGKRYTLPTPYAGLHVLRLMYVSTPTIGIHTSNVHRTRMCVRDCLWVRFYL